MKIKKGDWFRCIKTFNTWRDELYVSGKYYQSEQDGCITDELGGKDDVWNEEAVKDHFIKLHTIQDLRDGKVSVVNDGTFEEIKNLLNSIFPNDKDYPGQYRLYYSIKNGDEWCGSVTTNIPTQSVKDFLVQLPKESAKQCANNAQRNDPINPAHYKSYSVETIDMMIAIYGKEKTAIHCELTAFKYRMRAGKKGSVDECLKKENWYLNKAKELRNDNSVTKL